MTKTTEHNDSAKPKGLRLGRIADTKTGDYEVLHPITGEKLGAVFTLRGPEHPQRKAVVHRMMREARERAAAGATKAVDPSEDEAEALSLLAENITGWTGVFDAEGAELPYSAEEAQRLVVDPELQWLVDQLIAATRRRELFIRA